MKTLNRRSIRRFAPANIGKALILVLLLAPVLLNAPGCGCYPGLSSNDGAADSLTEDPSGRNREDLDETHTAEGEPTPGCVLDPGSEHAPGSAPETISHPASHPASVSVPEPAPDYTPTPASAPDLTGPLIVITFDDGNDTDLTVAYPLMEARGMKGVSYINTATVGQDGKLDWEEIAFLLASGWDIGCHTHTHPWLTALTDDEIRDEMQAVDAAFLAAGFEPPLHHAYPFTAYDQRVKNIVAAYRLTARGGEYPAGDFNRSDPPWHSLPALRIYIGDEAYFERIKKRIDLAAAQKETLILYTHRLTEDPGPYDTDPYYFAKLLDHIDSLGIETVTMSYLYRAHRNEQAGRQ